MTDAFAETWRPVPGFGMAYEVSDLGRVRSRDRVITRRDGVKQSLKGRVLSPGANTSGHLQVMLCLDGMRRMALVHRLVLEAFTGPAPEGFEGCHNDGNHSDNRLCNLRWDSHVENMRDILRHGLHASFRQTHCKYGHEYTFANTKHHKNGGRICRTCQVQQGKDAYARRLARQKGA